MHILYVNFKMFIIVNFLTKSLHAYFFIIKVVLEKQRVVLYIFEYINMYDVHKLAIDLCVVACVDLFKMIVIIYLFIWYVIIK